VAELAEAEELVGGDLAGALALEHRVRQERVLRVVAASPYSLNQMP